MSRQPAQISWPMGDNPSEQTFNRSTAFNYDDPALLSPISAAVFRGDLDEVKKLLAEGRSVNNIDNKGNTPLHVAILLEKEEIFNYFLSLKELQADAPNFESTTPLILACQHCRHFASSALMRRPDVEINARDHEQATPLHYAVFMDDLEVAIRLLDKGADINAKDFNSETPLVYACQNAFSKKQESIEIVCMLLERGADVHYMDTGKGVCPFIYACLKKNTELQDILFEYTFDSSGNVVDLDVLSIIMCLQTPYFPEIVKRTKRILYEDKDLFHLATRFTKTTAHSLSLLLKKFKPMMRDMFKLHSVDWLIHWTKVCDEETREHFIDSLYVLSETDNMRDFVTSVSVYPIIETVAKLFRMNDLPSERLEKVVMLLLSHGLDFYNIDMDSIYDTYGHSELFKLCLYQEIKPFFHPSLSLMEEISERPVMPVLLYDMPKATLEQFITETDTYVLRNIDKLLELTAHHKLRNLVLTSMTTRPDLVAKAQKLPTVPKLVELARNVGRNHIIKRYNVQNCSQFYTAIKSMDIVNLAKQILTYEKKLYL